jgi:hypothetical protein
MGAPTFQRGRPGGSGPQAATVAAPQPQRQASKPAKGGARRALFLNFNEKPVSIIRVMDDAKRQQAEFATDRARRARRLWLLLPAGLFFVLIDWLLGYSTCTFSLAGLGLWAMALLAFILLRRDRPTGQEFGPKFDAARTVFETIKDDVAPKRTLMGWLDLTGAKQPGKVVRESKSMSGTPIAFYRDEWLRMKASLYDGSILRVSAFERAKEKLGRWKRGSSGKMKWKPGRTVWTRHELRVAITPNQELPIQSGQVGKFNVQADPLADGRVVLQASTDAAVDAWDILLVLRFAYDHLQARTSPVATEGA